MVFVVLLILSLSFHLSILVLLSFWTISRFNINNAHPNVFQLCSSTELCKDYCMVGGVADELWYRNFLELREDEFSNFFRIYKLLISFNSDEKIYKILKIFLYPMILLYISLHFLTSAVVIWLYRLPLVGFFLNIAIFEWVRWLINALFVGAVFLPESICKVRLPNKKEYHKSKIVRRKSRKKPDFDPDGLNYCPKCGKLLERRTGKFGDFFGCTGYPVCKFSRNIW